MHRSILTALGAGTILLAFAALPPMLPGFTTMNLSGSALAGPVPSFQLSTQQVFGDPWWPAFARRPREQALSSSPPACIQMEAMAADEKVIS